MTNKMLLTKPVQKPKVPSEVGVGPVKNAGDSKQKWLNLRNFSKQRREAKWES